MISRIEYETYQINGFRKSIVKHLLLCTYAYQTYPVTLLSQKKNNLSMHCKKNNIRKPSAIIFIIGLSIFIIFNYFNTRFTLL